MPPHPTGAERLVTTAWRWFLAAGAVASISYFLLPGTSASLVYELLAGLAAAAVVVGVRLHGPYRSRGWFLVAAGIATWAFGDLLWSAHESLFDTPPFPSLVDVAYLGAYPLLLVGLARIVRDRGPDRDLPAVLDAAAVVVAVALPMWVFVVSPARADTDLTALGRLVATAYPVADVFLVGVLVRLLLSPGKRPAAYWLLFTGVVATLVGDVVFAVPSVSAGYAAGDPLDAAFLASYLLIGAAALHPSMVSVAHVTGRLHQPSSKRRIALVAVAGLSAPALLAVEAARGGIHHLPLILGGWCLLLGLVLTRLVAMMQELALESRLDPLTRLANRSHFLERVESTLRRTDAVDVALLYLDLDDFRAVNESIGRAGGDALLVAVADRLRTIVRPGDLVARPGGDEFVVLCEGVADEAGARTVAERLTAGLAQPFWYAGSPYFLSASIGISRATAAGDDAAALLTDAGAAMAQARVGGRSRAEVFDPEVQRGLSLRGRFERDLIDAVDRDELVLHYQPVLDLRSATVSGVEALVRWQHPDWGMTKPESMLPIAVETGLIVPIGRWVVAAACRQLRDWQRESPEVAPAEVTVNVARRELLDPGFVDHLEASLDRAGLPPGALVLDVADDDLSDAPTAVLDVLIRARGLGVHVCIDRFGAGRRSLSNIRRAPIDRVKVDRALVAGVADDPGDRLVLAAVLQLGDALGLQVTASGIETRSQRTQLERMGCTHAQGNLWAPPLPPGAVLDAVLGRVSR